MGPQMTLPSLPLIKWWLSAISSLHHTLTLSEIHQLIIGVHQGSVHGPPTLFDVHNLIRGAIKCLPFPVTAVQIICRFTCWSTPLTLPYNLAKTTLNTKKARYFITYISAITRQCMPMLFSIIKCRLLICYPTGLLQCSIAWPSSYHI